MNRYGRLAVALIFTVVVGLAVSATSVTDPYTFTQLDFPGMAHTIATGINNAGHIVGSVYSNLPQSQQPHGFRYSDGNFEIFDVPGALSTEPTDINNSGQIVGVFQQSTARQYGFLYGHGTFTIIDPPGAVSAQAHGVNDVGEVVGNFQDAASFDRHGFVDTAGVFTTIDVPGADSTFVTGINNAGHLVGYYTIMDSAFCLGCSSAYGFMYSKGIFTNVNVPGGPAGSYTVPLGINNEGQIVGLYSDSSGPEHGFVDTRGTFVLVDVPGAFQLHSPGTQAHDINEGKQIVGFFFDGVAEHGFLARPMRGRK